MSVMRKYNDMPDDVERLASVVVDSVFQVHQTLGPGYVEKIYEDCLLIEFEDRGLSVVRQYPINFHYKGRAIPSCFRLDMVIENKIILELKAVDKIHPVHGAQIYSYLKSSGLPLGFLVNFNVPLIRDGIKRYAVKSGGSL